MLSEELSEAEAKRRLRAYRDLREQLETARPGVYAAARSRVAAGATKAEVLRESGLSRPGLDNILKGSQCPEASAE
jgi:DNA-binding phage protein